MNEQLYHLPPPSVAATQLPFYANTGFVRWSVYWLLCVLALLGVTQAQSPSPTTKYKLHAQEEERSGNLPLTLLYLLPDQALLVLIPQYGGKWVLKRLTDWNTSHPREETLAFMGSPHQEGESGSDDLTVDPSGKYAIARLKSFRGNIFTVSQDSSAVVVLVDLRTFTLISRQETTEPLFALSDWAFAKTGMLIADARIKREPPPSQRARQRDPIIDTYQAGAFSLPDWNPTMLCKYQRRLASEKVDSQMSWSLINVGSECAALVAVAGVPAADNLPDGPPKSNPLWVLAGQDCQFGGQNVSATSALYECIYGHQFNDDIYITKSRNLTVLSLPDAKTILTIQLRNHFKPYRAVLADANNHTWLVIVQDGIKLETYRLP